MIRQAVKHDFYLGNNLSVLTEVIRDIAHENGMINRRRLGRWIKRHSGRIVNGKRFVHGNLQRSAESWRVEVVNADGSKPTGPVLSTPVTQHP